MLILPQVRNTYDPDDIRRLYAALQQADAENRKLYKHVVIASPGELLLQSPDGTWWTVNVANSGALGTTSGSHP